MVNFFDNNGGGTSSTTSTKEQNNNGNINFFSNSTTQNSTPISVGGANTNRTFKAKDGTTVSESKVNEWLDPNYEWADGEKKLAKSVVKNYKKASEFKNIDNNDKAYYLDTLSELDARTKTGQSVIAFEEGVLKSFPGVKAVYSLLENNAKNNGNDSQVEKFERDKSFESNHKFAEGLGNFVGKASQYSLAKNIPAVGKVADKIGGALGGSRLAQGVGNIAADTLVDLGLDTIPELAVNVSEGKSGGEIAKDAAKNIGTNIAFNVGGEALSMGAEAYKNAKSMVDTLADNVKNYDIPELDTASKIVKNADDVVKNTDNVAKSVDDAVKNADVKVDAEPIKEVVNNATDNAKVTNLKEVEAPWVSLNGTAKRRMEKFVEYDGKAVPVYKFSTGGNAGYYEIPLGTKPGDVIGIKVNPLSGEIIEIKYEGKNKLKSIVSHTITDKLAFEPEPIAKSTVNETVDPAIEKLYKESEESIEDYSGRMMGNADDVARQTDDIIPEIAKQTDDVADSVKQTELPKVEEPTPELPKLEEPKIEELKLEEPKVEVEEPKALQNPDTSNNIPKTEEPIEFNAPDKYAQIEKVDNVAEATKELPSTEKALPGNAKEVEPKYGESKMVVDGTLNRNAITSMDFETGREIAKYKVISEGESIEEATKRLSTPEGYKYWNDALIKGDASIESPMDVDTTMSLLLDKKHKIAELDEYIKNGGSDSKEAMGMASQMQTEMDILSMRLRMASTKNAQALQALAKWNRNVDGAVTNAERLLDEQGKKWAKHNGNKMKSVKNESEKIVESAKEVKAKTPLSSKLKKALDGLVDKSVFKNTDGNQKTHADFLAEVKGTLEREMSSFDSNFTDTDYEVLATFLEKGVEPEVVSDELAHRLKYGSWYTLDESVEELAKPNSVVNDALRKMLGEDVVKEITETTKADLRKSVKATLEGELASVIDDLSDMDIDYVTNLVENGIKSDELAVMLSTRASTGKWTIDKDVIEQVNDIFKQADIYNIDSKNRVELENKAFALLADNIYGRGGTFWEKFDQWRFLAMLGNTKTHIRNVVSNAIFGTVNDVSNTLAATMEEMVDRTSKAMGKGGIDRTKALINPTTDSGLLKGALKDADDSAYRQLSGSKYSVDLKRSIENQRKVFKSKGMNFVSEGNTKLLEMEDIAFNKKKYSTSLAGYLKANGLDDSVFEAERKLAQLEGREALEPLLRQEADDLKAQVDILNKGREYAVAQAQYSTFHEDNAIAEGISRIQRNVRQSDNALKRMGGKMLEGVVPFTKTPMNILRSGIEYSPLGIIRDAVDIKELAKGNMSASQFVENLSKTLTGTSLFLLGMWMYDNDVLSASKDTETGDFDTNQGKQAYAIKLGGKTFTIDFAVPSAMPLLVGAEVKKVLENRKGFDSDAFMDAISNREEDWVWDALDAADLSGVLNAMSSIAEPINDTSMLSGINDSIDAIKNNDNILGTLAANALTGYATQSVPTFLGQIARTVDNTRRSTYAGHEGVTGAIEKQANKIQNKIPFLSDNNEAYVDLWGREQKNGPDNALGNLAYQMLSPSYSADINTTPVDAELQTLYDDTKEKSVLPSSHAYKIGDERMSQSERYTYSKVNGETRYDLLENLIDSDLYKTATDSEKVELVSNIYTLSAKVAKYEVTGDDSADNTKLYSAYKSGGVPSVIDYFTTKTALENAGFSIGNDKAISVYDKYGENGLTIMKNIKSLGSTKKETLTGYLDKMNMTNEEKAYWFGLFNTGANPYSNESGSSTTTTTKKNFNR